MCEGGTACPLLQQGTAGRERYRCGWCGWCAWPWVPPVIFFGAGLRAGDVVVGPRTCVRVVALHTAGSADPHRPLSPTTALGRAWPRHCQTPWKKKKKQKRNPTRPTRGAGRKTIQPPPPPPPSPPSPHSPPSTPLSYGHRPRHRRIDRKRLPPPRRRGRTPGALRRPPPGARLHVPAAAAVAARHEPTHGSRWPRHNGSQDGSHKAQRGACNKKAGRGGGEHAQGGGGGTTHRGGTKAYGTRRNRGAPPTTAAQRGRRSGP